MGFGETPKDSELNICLATYGRVIRISKSHMLPKGQRYAVARQVPRLTSEVRSGSWEPDYAVAGVKMFIFMIW